MTLEHDDFDRYEETMADLDPDDPDREFDGWAVLEVMGHVRVAGRVRTCTLGAAPMFRVDIPVADEYVTRFFAAHAIFSLSPVDERGARAVALHTGDTSPIKHYELPSPGRFERVTRDQLEHVVDAIAGTYAPGMVPDVDRLQVELMKRSQFDDEMPF